MKQKDIAMIIGVAVIAGVISLIVTRMVFVTPDNRQQEVEVVQPISTSFSQPDSAYFNSSSIDPTQTIQIGNSNNPAPFKGSSE